MKWAMVFAAMLGMAGEMYGAPGLAPLIPSPAAQPRGVSQLSAYFAAPPDSARPWVFYFWLNGNVTSNGLTADLEAMKRVGIGGVALMDVSQGTPPGPVRFGSPHWHGLFQHACTEAQRLGLQIDMHNAAGWCGSGGPWVTPELSMKTVVWSETRIDGPTNFNATLSRPITATDHYRDLAVFAFRTPPGEDATMASHSPRVTGSPGAEVQGGHPQRITIPRPESGRPVFFQIEFDRPYTARSIRFDVPLGNGEVCHGELQVSDDGKAFRRVRMISVEYLKKWYGFPTQTARFYRITFTSAEPSLKTLTISNLDLSQKFRIEDFESKALFVRRWEGDKPDLPSGFLPELGIRREEIVDLTGKMLSDGRVQWKAPAGSWTVLRMGYASNGKTNHPAQPEGTGLECDKLSKDGIEAVFKGFIKKLAENTRGMSPNPLVSVHVDSWEVGAQNWTATFRSEFKRRRGYDPLPWLPVMTGRAIDSLDISERFLWDLRITISEMLADNYAGRLRELAHRHGMRLSIEAYGENPSDDLTYGGRADEPMAELWSWYPYTLGATCTEMSSVAHVYGKPVVSLEALTAVPAEKWQGHPYGVKVYGDWAFASGINKMIIHRYAHQPWTDPDRAPGMSMGPWGLHYERTQTWWEQSAEWHRYLARCQYLLQQGKFVADICYLAPEMAPRMWLSPSKTKERPGYNFDGCPAEVVLTRMSTRNGRIVLPDGMSYGLLALSDTRAMTPRLLRKIRELVRDGATIVGPPPERAPGLSDYPDCDEDIRRMAAQLWGKCDGTNVVENRFGKGRVIWGRTPEQVFAQDGLPPDFTSAFLDPSRGVASAAGQTSAPSSAGLRYTHRRSGQTDIYFVANPYLEPVEVVCEFRVSREPQFWWPDTGRIEPAGIYASSDSVTTVQLRLDPAGSVFVVFPPSTQTRHDPIDGLSRDGKPLLTTHIPAGPSRAADDAVEATNTFTMAGWVRPDMPIDLPPENDTGVVTFNVIRNDALYPPAGDEVYDDPTHAGTGFSVGVNGLCVLEHSANYFASPLVHAAPLTNWTYVTIVYRDRTPYLFLNGKFARKGMRSSYDVHSGVGVEHRRGVAPFRGSLGEFRSWARALSEDEIAQVMKATPVPRLLSHTPTAEVIQTQTGRALRTWEPGDYVARNRNGQSWSFTGEPPPLLEIHGPWQLRFPSGPELPAEVNLERLISWSDHADPAVKYFSGKASYRKTFDLPAAAIGKDRRFFLDLGEVHVMAEVKLNGRAFATLWKSPYRIDITQAARAGSNDLELQVVNLWPNRMVGDEQLLEDSNRQPNGTLREWPDWLQAGQPSPTGRQTFSTWRLWKKNDPLLPSGLLGPVRIITTHEFPLDR